MEDLKRPNGYVIGTYVKKLKDGECPCKYDGNIYIIKDRIIYKRV